ncbi:MAG: biotin synthase BioB [Candidatus Latescibacteria bacterium]|nr:biotin synthase BioB [Candidatus Latescibacterota bacterium]
MKDYTILERKALQNESLANQEMLAVLETPDEDLLLLVHAAYRVRHRFFGNSVRLHVLQNAKSGLCPEDCAYCSQSAVSTADIGKYPLLPREQILDGARKAKAGRALRYCIVTSGRGPTDREVDTVADIVREVKQTVDIDICCCMGLLDEAQARTLKAAGVDRVNHNLNTGARHHGNIVSTHTYSDRLNTLKAVKAAGLETCCGGIVGMGESRQDIVDLAVAVRELDIDSIPVNFLHPIDGTPLAGRKPMSPQDGLKVLCLFRFVNPNKEIRIAGGRELTLGSLQALALYPANSVFMEGYLTTGGQSTSETHRLIEDLGFEVEAHSKSKDGSNGTLISVS